MPLVPVGTRRPVRLLECEQHVRMSILIAVTPKLCIQFLPTDTRSLTISSVMNILGLLVSLVALANAVPLLDRT
jgi:hypothetical protein